MNSTLFQLGKKAWTLGWIEDYEVSFSNTYLWRIYITSASKKLPKSAAWTGGFLNTVTQLKINIVTSLIWCNKYSHSSKKGQGWTKTMALIKSVKKDVFNVFKQVNIGQACILHWNPTCLIFAECFLGAGTCIVTCSYVTSLISNTSLYPATFQEMD